MLFSVKIKSHECIRKSIFKSSWFNLNYKYKIKSFERNRPKFFRRTTNS